jgi:hypothetical protein
MSIMTSNDIEIVRSFARTVEREIEQRKALVQQTRTRLVWFVAISGYVLLNGKTLWESIIARTATGSEILMLSAPWLISSLMAFLTHYLCDRAEMNSHKFYSNKLVMIDLHLTDLASEQPDLEMFKSLLFDEAPEIKTLKKDADSLVKKVNTFESLSLLFIVLGFAWSIGIPYLLR